MGENCASASPELVSVPLFPADYAVLLRKSIIIRIGGRSCIHQEVVGVQRRDDGVKWQRSLVVVKTVGQVVGVHIGEAQRGQAEILFDVF